MVSFQREQANQAHRQTPRWLYRAQRDFHSGHASKPVDYTSYSQARPHQVPTIE